MGIFELLENESHTAYQIKEKIKLNCQIRNLIDFLDVLHSKGHIERIGILEDARYKTSHNLFLKSNPINMIAIIYWVYKVFGTLMMLPEALRTGNIQGENSFDQIYKNDDMILFLRTMAILQKENFYEVVSKLDLSNFSTLIDIGGCLGEFCMTIKRKNPKIQCTSFDLPVVEKFFNAYIQENGMQGQILFRGGDMFKEEFPKSDVVAMGNILHDWNDEKKRILFKKAYNALNENGIFVIVENFIDNQRKDNINSLVMSLLMLVESVQGFNMTNQDVQNYSSNVGFKNIQFLTNNSIICFKKENINNQQNIVKFKLFINLFCYNLL